MPRTKTWSNSRPFESSSAITWTAAEPVAPHVCGRELWQLGDVAQPLDRVGLSREHLLATHPDSLHEPQHEGVGAEALEGTAGGSVELEEALGAVASLRGQLRAVERDRDGRGHVDLASPRELGQPCD